VLFAWEKGAQKLRVCQFRKIEDGYIYTENVSKNRSGGLGQLNLANKSVKLMRCLDAVTASCWMST